jgi:NCS1 family nucleobase:cation symporter-1
VLILPWNLYSSPAVISYFLGGLAALLAPLVGIILVDYYLVRRQTINVPALYCAEPNAQYHYTRGFNLRALAAFGIASAVSLVLALVPAFAPIAPFSWVGGVLLAAGLYRWLMRGRSEVEGALVQLEEEANQLPEVEPR